MTILIIIVLLVILVAGWVMSTQRRLVVMDENINNAMSQIGVQLSSRFDALTALLDLAKGYAAHESQTLIETIKSRRSVITAKSTPQDVLQQEGVISEALGRISMVAERYPELKADKGYAKCMDAVDSYEKIDAVLERVASIREATGKYFGIAVDFHGRVHKPMAKILAKKLEEFDPMFIEEPVLCEQMEDFKEIAAACNVPIATGERLFSRYDFKRLLQAGGVDIIQPDLSHAGGITEVKKIASMAEAYDVALAPHCPLGPIALSACLQVDATCYNAFIQEQSMGIHYNAYHEPLDYILNKEDLAFHDGHVELPKRPGLGVEVNEALVLEEAQTPHSWKNPVWRHKDGSVAEW